MSSLVACDIENTPLKIIELGYPSLRSPSRELSKEEILTPEIQDLIKEMARLMREAPGVGLAAPQIGKSLQIAVIEDVNHSHLTPEQIVEREREIIPFHVIINPKIYLDEKEKALFFEGCLSVPNWMGAVSRAKKVRVECLNEKGEYTVIEAKGWYARILQHEIDHLQGSLYIDKVEIPTLMTIDNYGKYWASKSLKETIEILGINKVSDSSYTLQQHY